MSENEEGDKGGETPAQKLEAEAKKLKAEAEKLESRAEELEAEADKLEKEAEQLEGKKPIEVVVNEKHPVKLEGREQTGLSIKQAAIKQSVPIQLDFVLSIERGGGKTEIIGDGQNIKVKDGDRFLAIPNDDNS
jgi:predicted RNase H-like nuclease (RuvC/YqgF family)